MQIGMIGLGRMGANMARRLLRGGHQVVAVDINEENRQAVAAEGAQAVASLPELVAALEPPRAVWLMIPAGEPVEKTVLNLIPLLSAGDIIVDGGNSNYKDSVARAERVALANMYFLDCGTSGGVWGLTEGYCLMLGGPQEAFAQVEPVLQTLAPPDGYALVGPSGAGHYLKMIHNGIEYAMLQAYGEGFELLQARADFGFDLPQVARLWNHGSVVRSWLLELAQLALEREPDLDSIKDWVADSGEGRWTVKESIDMAIPAPTIALALMQRFSSRQEESFSNKLIAALRNEFGGHAVKKEGS